MKTPYTLSKAITLLSNLVLNTLARYQIYVARIAYEIAKGIKPIHKSYTRSKITFGFCVLLVALFFIAPFSGYTQTTGDYKSVATGNWATLSTWNYYNGTSWVAATSYPGQNTGTGTVTIQGGYTVTLGQNITNTFTKLVIGDGIDGVDILAISAKIDVATPSVVVAIGGCFYFNTAVEFHLPTGATFIVLGPVVDGVTGVVVSGTCVDGQKIRIGGGAGEHFASCTGLPKDANPTLYSFSELNASGGVAELALSTSSNAPLCVGSSLYVTATVSGSGAATATFSWSGAGPSGYTYSSSNKTPTITGLASGSYTFTATAVDVNYTGFSKSQVLNVVVAPPSAGGTVTGGTEKCTGNTSGLLTLTGHTGTVTKWQLSTVSNFTTSTDIANTNSTYTSGALTTTTYFRAVVASGVCASANASATTVTIAPAKPTITTAISGPSIVCLSNPSVTFSIASVTNATSYSWTLPVGWSFNSGQGTNSVNVIAGNTNGTVTLTASNGCGTSNQVLYSSFSMVNTFYAVHNADVSALSSWTSSSNGTGINPYSFAVSGLTFQIPSGRTGNVNANYTINNATLQVEGTLSPLPSVTISGTGTLTGTGTVQCTRQSEFNVQYTIATKTLASVTVQYASVTGGQSISALTYAKLTLLNTSGTNTAMGNINVTTNLTTTAGGTLDMSTYILDGGLPTVSNAGTIRFSGASNGLAISTGTVEYSGTTQNIAAGTYTNLAISGGGTKTLAGVTTVNGVLALTNGIVRSSTSNSLAMGTSASYTGGTSNASFVDGPMTYTIATTAPTAKVFPVGTFGSIHKMEMTVVQTDATATTYIGQYFTGDANALGWSLPASGITNVSKLGYWHIAKSNQSIQGDGSDANLVSVVFTLHYNSNDAVNNPAQVLVAKSNSVTNKWMSGGVGNYTASTVTSTAFNGFSDLVLGSEGNGNPLPIELIDFNASIRKK